MKEQKWIEEGWFYHNHAWHLLHEILKLIKEIEVNTLLDFGAGTGLAASIIRAIFPEIQIDVCDIENESKTFWDKRGLNGFIYKGSINKNYDLIFTSHVIEHIADPEKTIINLFNHCNKRLIIVVPDNDVHFHDHKVIYNRAKLEETISGALKEHEFKYRSYPVYHTHINNLVAVIDK